MKLFYKVFTILFITTAIISCNKKIPDAYIGSWQSSDNEVFLGITEDRECTYRVNYEDRNELLVGNVKVKEKKDLMKICAGSRCEEYTIDKSPDVINGETYMILAGDSLFKTSNTYFYTK